MWRARQPFPVLPVAIGVVMLLLGTLATLQYRWAGELSEAEHARLRASARTRAESLGRDFDAEISRAFRQLELNGDAVRSHDFAAWVERYEGWQRAAAWPRLVRSVYLVEPNGASDTVSRFDPVARAFAPIAWPAELEPLRRRVRPEPGGRPRMFEPIAEEVPALVMLAFDRREGTGAHPPEPGPPGESTPFVVAVLDLDVIRAQVLPALAERYFGGRDARNRRGGRTSRAARRARAGRPARRARLSGARLRRGLRPLASRGLEPRGSARPGGGGRAPA